MQGNDVNVFVVEFDFLEFGGWIRAEGTCTVPLYKIETRDDVTLLFLVLVLFLARLRTCAPSMTKILLGKASVTSAMCQTSE